MTRKYRVAILGYYGFGNLGDEILLQAVLEILNRCSLDREKIIVLSNNPKQTSEDFNVASVNRWSFRDVITTLRESDTLLLGGGGLFQDTTSIKSCIWYWGVSRLANFLGVKLWALGQSIGPLHSRLARILTRDALKLCKRVHVRDEKSFMLAKNLGCENVIQGYDLALNLHKSNPHDDLKSCTDKYLRRNTTDTNSYVLVNLRPSEKLQDSVDIIAPHVKNFPLQKIGVALSPDDEEILQHVREKLCLDKIVSVENFHDAQTLWQNASCAVGMRLHFGVLSQIFHIPLALIPYDMKVSEFAKQSGIPCIINNWQNPQMPSRIPADIDKIYSICSEILSLW